jgi:predicted PhzF superfamily epimerase YddE/YHI9
MRDVAGEMNLSETAFLVKQADGYNLRWFTPAVEVDLCGHATWPAPMFLWQDGHLPEGCRPASIRAAACSPPTAAANWIELDFPAKIAAACEPPAELLPALGITSARFTGRNAFDYFVEIESDAELRALKPDHSRLAKPPGPRCDRDGAFVFARIRFCLPLLRPGSGIDEDPVTGSAHTALGPYWAKILGKTEMLAYQASHRGGVVRLH